MTQCKAGTAPLGLSSDCCPSLPQQRPFLGDGAGVFSCKTLVFTLRAAVTVPEPKEWSSQWREQAL